MKTICISHAEDADGLICAAYLRHLRNASIVLVTYDEFRSIEAKSWNPRSVVFGGLRLR